MNGVILVGVAIVSFLSGVFIDEFTGIQVSRSVSIADILNFVATVGVILIVPLTLDKFINSQKEKRNIISEDACEVFRIVASVRALLFEKKQARLEKPDRQSISFMISDLSRQTTIVRDSLERLYPRRSLKIRNAIEKAFLTFKAGVTGGELFNESFEVSPEFLRDFELEYDRFISNMKEQQFNIRRL